MLDLRELAGSVERDLPVSAPPRRESRTATEDAARTIKVKEGEQVPQAVLWARRTSRSWQPATGKWLFGMTIVQALWTTFNIEMRARA